MNESELSGPRYWKSLDDLAGGLIVDGGFLQSAGILGQPVKRVGWDDR
ncbi:MAG: hypothetical protein ACPGSB_12390 [Opitutales bacterium]